MSTRKNFFLIFAAFLCLALSGCASRVITVVINNKSDAAIHNVEVTYNGGSYGVSSIAAGAVHQNHIKPFGPSTLQIDYVDASGKKKTQAGPRVAKNDSGTVQVTITNNDFKWTGNLSAK
ncbi:MAG: hypothetical protein JWO20_769 [Candidatus Angelobacter sp.]|nr:hypothetical protein [Candidatus Angelobacter sp.]